MIKSSAMSNIFALQTTKDKIIVITFVILIITIPVGSYLIKTRSNANQANTPKTTSKLGTITQAPPQSSSSGILEDLKKLDQNQENQVATQSSTANAVSFGPTLTFKLNLEGRAANDQATKSIFVGIAAGNPENHPTYLLSFTVDLPASGLFEGLSLAGLNPGTQYTAYIKPPSQLATSSAFVMTPAVSNLNNGSALNLLTGDLNDDNIINAADYSIAKSLYGTTPASPNWNPRADFNNDGLVNSADLAYIIKNFGQSGMSGAWYSPPPPASNSATTSATSSGGLNTPVPEHNGGYWIWVPKM